jgi:acyl-CoA dehydrogenase
MILTEEQELLQQTAREFANEHLPVTHLRELRDAGDPDGFSRDLWKQMAELGWTGILLPEEYGGADLGYAELGVVLEELGRTLAPTPLFSTVVLGAPAVLAGAGEALRKEILTAVCSGEALLALAFQETGRFDPRAISLRAERSGSGFALSGQKNFVSDGHVADHVVVAARTAGSAGDRDGITLFLVPGNAAGLTRTRTQLVDSRGSANLAFDGVEVAQDRVLGEVDRGADLLEPLLDRATIALCSELVGTVTEAFERTIEYLKTREQFDALIGTFQALKHRAAQMFCEVELSQAVVLEGLRAIDEDRKDVPLLASAAKARCSDTAGLVTREAIQMHGGIGMTDEEDIGLFLKRARVAELSLGDARYHRTRFAELNGF